MEKIRKAAIEAKKLGYTHISSVVKSHYATTYYNVNEIDEVISRGWIPAQKYNGYRHGVSRLPEKTISRQSALKLV